MTEIPAVANYIVLGVGAILTTMLIGCIGYLTIYRCLCGVIMCPKFMGPTTGRFSRRTEAPGALEAEKEPLLSTFPEIGREGCSPDPNPPETLVSV
jgi:hypothetical protein